MAEDKKDVFISYCTKNSELAQFLCNQLEGSGVSCWIAPRDIPPAGEWANAIVDGIDEAKVVALLVSESSMASKEVAKEIDLANSSPDTEMIPVRIENTMLQKAFRYHLSNKQWVDAYGDEKQTRFAATITAIRSMLKKEAISNNAAEGSVQGKARKLVAELNKKYSKGLDAINSLFSLREERAEGENNVSLFLPIRIGATGFDLIFKFGGDNMEIYVDAASSGDWLPYPFFNHILSDKKVSAVFPNKSWDKKKKYKSILLLPPTRIELLPPTNNGNRPLVMYPEAAFEVFGDNTLFFLNTLLPSTLKWAGYAIQVASEVRKLEEKLRILFSEKEGWRVGAPEGWRLDGFRPYGNICVFKKDWVPNEGDYRGRGLLSLALESGDAFLKDLYIGVLKYEDWMNLGDYSSKIVDEGKRQLSGEDKKGNAWWVWRQSLGSDFNNSGIGEAALLWEGKLDDFVKHCLDKFEKLKGLENILSEACRNIPSMQVAEPDSFPEDKRKWDNGLYIQNWLRKIATDLNSIAIENGLSLDYRYRKSEKWQDIRLKLRVGNFDAAVAFRYSWDEMRMEISNLEPPDFETHIIKDFFEKKHADFNFEDNSKLLKKERFELAIYGGKVEARMERFQKFVSDNLTLVIPVIGGLKRHLEQVVDLTSYAEKEMMAILTKEDGWEIENKANTLERQGALTIYRASWRSKASQEKYPP